jgi:hypothetical protein
MDIREKANMKGSYLIKAINADTGEPMKIWRFDNQLTTINQDIRSQMLAGNYTAGNNALEIRYFAFGTGNTPPTASDTRLESEIYRKQVTQLTQSGAGVVTSVVSLGSLECNYHIQEIGVFCGPSATADENTGTMISRVLFDLDKNTNIVLNIVRTDTCTLN